MKAFDKLCFHRQIWETKHTWARRRLANYLAYCFTTKQYPQSESVNLLCSVCAWVLSKVYIRILINWTSDNLLAYSWNSQFLRPDESYNHSICDEFPVFLFFLSQNFILNQVRQKFVSSRHLEESSGSLFGSATNLTPD